MLQKLRRRCSANPKRHESHKVVRKMLLKFAFNFIFEGNKIES